MFLPYGDTPNPPGFSPVNSLLIAVNVGIFLFISLPLSLSRPDLGDPLLLEYLRIIGVRGHISAQQVLEHVSAYDLFVFRYGYRPAAASLTTLFTSMFLHGGWLHLAGNMLFLYIFGDNVEHRLGPVRYLFGYLMAGVAATLFFSLFVPGSQIPLVGASGAISGVLGCYFVWFPRNQVKTLVLLFPILMQTLYLPARLVLGFYLILDNLIPFLLTTGRGSGVAYGAHIGGFLFGVIAAWGLDQRKNPVAAGTVGSAVRSGWGRLWSRQMDGGKVAAAQIGELLQQGRAEKAARLYLTLSGEAERLMVTPEAVLAIGAHLLQKRQYESALNLFRRFIAERPASPDVDRAYLGAGRAMLYLSRGNYSARQYLLAAVDTARSEEVARTARELLRRLESAEGC